jgi:hypothetical protein
VVGWYFENKAWQGFEKGVKTTATTTLLAAERAALRVRADPNSGNAFSRQK